MPPATTTVAPLPDAYFVTCEDAGRHAFLLGPFSDEERCKYYAYGEGSNDIVQACMNIDPKAHFFGYGMAKIRYFVPGSRIGILNKNWPEKWQKVIS